MSALTSLLARVMAAILALASLLIRAAGGMLSGSVAALLVLVPLSLTHHLSRAMQNRISLAGEVGGAVIALVAWRLLGQGRTSTAHGSARFATLPEIRASLAVPRGLIVGREPRRNGRLLRYDGPSHLITVAPTRSGKGVGAVIPNLLTADRSILCIDPKGENTRATALVRARFGPVHVLDPFGVTGQSQAQFNPLDGLSPVSLDLAEDAALLAEAMVHDPPGLEGEAHWNEEAKALIAGIILHLVCEGFPHERTLTALRERLTESPQRFAEMLKTMQASSAAGDLVRRAANRQLGKGDREASGVLSSAQRHTHFLDSARLGRTLEASDFRFADLKRTTATVFLVLPPERLHTHARWLRLLVAQAIQALAREPAAQASPVLFLLDEFAALGRLEPVMRAFGLMAGYGLQLWPILQDLHQLKAAYGDGAGTFLSNAGLIQLFNVADIDTASWVSRSLGATTVAYVTEGSSVSRGMQPLATHGESSAGHLARRDLLTPDEVMRLHPGEELLLRPGEAPAIAWKVRYFADPEFRGLI